MSIMDVAKDLVTQNATWVEFYDIIFGLEGAIEASHPTWDEYKTYLKSDEAFELQIMLAELRQRGGSGSNDNRVITVRLPKAIHNSLSDEACRYQTSVNKLCVSKLLQSIDERLIPTHTTHQPSQLEAVASGE